MRAAAKARRRRHEPGHDHRDRRTAGPRAWQAGATRSPDRPLPEHLGLILVLVGGVVFSPSRHGQLLFLAPDNVANIVRAISETGIIALGMTFVIITGGIDLSVGAVLGLASVLAATLMVNAGWGIAATLVAVVLAGLAFGAVQGLISNRFRLEAFIVTLAGLQVARGWR